jgi:glutamate synthase (NADPH) small chain
MEEKKNPKLERTEMVKQSPHIRRRNFKEVALGYTEELALLEATRCLNCKASFCKQGCPVEIDIPKFISLIAQHDFAGSIAVLKEKNCLPAVCGRVCPQEEQCEKFCILAKKDASICIGRLERFAADWEARQGTSNIPKIPKSTGKKVVVVGAGPAGITVAGDLILQGHDVTMYEALHDCGGVLTYGIPEFRLPKAIVRREVEYLRKLGVKVIPNYIVGKTKTVSELLEIYDAMFIGTGAGLPWFMNMPGENLNGVYSANEYLTRMNLMGGYQYPHTTTPVKKHHNFAVVGGGNVAMDCARTAVRLGAENVYIIYRRSEHELPARREEFENAEEEGIIFNFLTLPIRLIGDENGWIKEIECIRMELGEPDSSGRRSPVPIPDSNFILPMDGCVIAIGNSPNPIIPTTTSGLEIGRHGNIVADEKTGKTTLDRVWAGGDIVSGAATVILAMGAGRIAARSMHEFLMQEKK